MRFLLVDSKPMCIAEEQISAKGVSAEMGRYMEHTLTYEINIRVNPRKTQQLKNVIKQGAINKIR